MTKKEDKKDVKKDAKKDQKPVKTAALVLLQRIAAQVRPVMAKRGWHVGVLREFFPGDARLLGLNVNRGQEIRIRLRPAHDDRQFLIYEDLVGTMLHELVHIVQGPHDAVFYRLLDELKAETEAMLAKGYTGDGFFSQGKRVGHGVSHDVPRHQAREMALKAAEQRRRRAQALGLGGQPRTLGGVDGGRWAELQRTHSPQQMAALAAERRMRDEKWCGENAKGLAEATQPHSGDDVVAEPWPTRSSKFFAKDHGKDCNSGSTGSDAIALVVISDSDRGSDSGSDSGSDVDSDTKANRVAGSCTSSNAGAGAGAGSKPAKSATGHATAIIVIDDDSDDDSSGKARG
ncbi:hypothetical protein GGI07_005359 [Coemansia sp. Benny D115]|nr:hypothetical protein GGI07_005359 [Coemansia sp. Benny D115]